LYLLYQFAAIKADPVLAAWNVQNVTPAPPAWDFMLSLSPVLPLTLVAAWSLLRGGGRGQQAVGQAQNGEYGRIDSGLWLLLVWALGGLLLAYLPFALQRRFLLGYYVPLAGLAAWGLVELQRRWPGRARLLRRLTVGLALPTNGVVLLLALFGSLSHAPELYLTAGEAAVLGWLRENSAANALVLASPEMGLYIPAHTGRRVIYGHPFETINAEKEEQAVTSVYSGELRGLALERFLAERGVDWIVDGEREQALGGAPAFLDYPLAFANGANRVYAVHELP
jgi:hypothetical protein